MRALTVVIVSIRCLRERPSGRSGSPAGAGGRKASKAFNCRIVKGSENFPDIPAVVSDWELPVYTLDPANIDPALLGGNFDRTGGNQMEIATLMYDSYHTFYARPAAGADSTGVPRIELTKLTVKSKLLEMVKRLLEVKPAELFNVADTYKIGDITPDNLRNSSDTNELVKAVRTLLTGDGDRDAAAQLLNETIIGSGLGGTILSDLPYKEYLLEVFPQSSDSSDWADDFLNLLVFWTGSTTTNACVLYDNITGFNFSVGLLAPPDKLVKDKWEYVLGITPLLFLNTTAPITLTPDFQSATIVKSNQAFDSVNSWSLPAGKKQPLDYRYDFTEPFTKDRAGNMCVRKNDLSELVSSFQKTYNLTHGESSVLSQELTSQFPPTSDFVRLSLARPTDIASRIRWLGDGEPLSILQLFFDFTPNACTSRSLIPPALTIRADRDGFEVGVIK